MAEHREILPRKRVSTLIFRLDWPKNFLINPIRHNSVDGLRGFLLQLSEPPVDRTESEPIIRRLGACPMQSAMSGLLLLMSCLAVPDEPKPEDRFAGEPTRPKAMTAIKFGKSWDQARSESARTGRRILVVFTGDNCGWCRVLEKRTFGDAEVEALSREFVCVELNVGHEENARLVDQYQVDTIPRSFVLSVDGQVSGKRTGYVPPTEYVAWLREARTRSPHATKPDGPAPAPPNPVGAPDSEADVVIWSIDASQSIKRWGDDDWTGHAQLLRLLRQAGLRPRVEHLSRDSFASRWDQAEAGGRVPELIVADQLAGLVRDLERKGRLHSVISERLSWTPENASCPDFAGRMAFRVVGSPRADAGQKALDELLKPGPELTLPGQDLPEVAGRAEAVAIARRAVVAYISGDPRGLEVVASKSSPQLSRCVKPEAFRQGREVVAGSVEVQGNESIAFARVEMRFRGETAVGADSVLVVLHREASRWKAFAVSSDIITLKELPPLCRLEFRAGAEPDTPPTPRLLDPIDGEKIGVGGKSFTWEIPVEGGALAAQVCQVLLDSGQASSWPETRLKVDPGMPKGRSLFWAETAKDLTGVSSERMSWCVWAVDRTGRIFVSSVASYLRPELKY